MSRSLLSEELERSKITKEEEDDDDNDEEEDDDDNDEEEDDDDNDEEESDEEEGGEDGNTDKRRRREKKEKSYQVQEEDTLHSISLKTGVPIALLKKLNRLYGKNRLIPGQVLLLAPCNSTWKNNNGTTSLTSTGKSSASEKEPRDAHIMNEDEKKKKLKNDNKHVSFMQKERLKSKSTRNLINEKSADGEDIELSSRFLQSNKKSNSFKYKCNSTPDLVALNTPDMLEENNSSTRNHRQSITTDRIPVKERRYNSDWTVYNNTNETNDAKPAAKDDSSFSFSSLPKTLLMGSLEFLESYFGGTPTSERNTTKADSCPLSPMSSRKLSSFEIQLHGNSAILLHSHIRNLEEHFPASIQNEAWELLFCTELHGTDFASFFHRCKLTTYSLLVVRSEDNQVFGGFASETWRMARHGKQAFYGTGESFLFRCHPQGETDEDDADVCNVDVFEWQYDNYFFMWSNQKQIAMGGGGGQFGFVLDEDFTYAETNPCETFGNPRLTTHTKPFKVSEVELWGFGHRCRDDEVEMPRSREHEYFMAYDSS